MKGRPLLYTSYEADQGLLNTTSKKVMLGLFLLVLVSIPFQIIPGLKFLGQSDWLRLLSTTAIFAIGALGLNILTGLAGQVSLGHAFFMGVGAYTAVWLGGPVDGPLLGLGLPIWIWLPAAGIVAALIGVAVGPTAVRVRGLYLAIVTLGLVFIGDYLFRNWASLTGGAQVGRDFPPLEFRWWKEEPPVIDFTTPSVWFGVEVSGIAKTFFLLALLAGVYTLLAKNLQRTRVGRAFMSIRDRDIAAEIMGVNEFAYKLLAFGISSFYAGIAGALLASFLTRVIPEQWNLFLSVQFIAIILIGGRGHSHRRPARIGVRRPPAPDRAELHPVAAIARPRRRRDSRRYCQCVHGDIADGLRVDQHHGRCRPRALRRPAEPRPIRSTDHRVSHLRAARLVRDLAPHPQLLEGLAVHLLSGHERARALTSNRGGRNE